MSNSKKNYNPKNIKHTIPAAIGTLLIIFGFTFGILVVAGAQSNKLDSSLTAPEWFILSCLVPITLGYWLIRRLTASSKAALKVIVDLISRGF